MPSTGHTQRGFTLTELLVALAIAGILAMIGAPAMGSLLAHVEDANTEAAVAAGLRHARTAAVMRNTRILVCPSNDGQHCQPDDDWRKGWIIARDADHDGQPDADTTLVAVQAAMPAGTGIITSTGRKRLTFHPDGSAAGSNASFTICHARQHAGIAVVVSNSGRVRLDTADREHLQKCLAAIP
jgi:type IV fimbrial biogenesis protein FimT